MSDTSNYVYLAMTANHWGSGVSEKSALSNLRLAGGSSSITRSGYSIYRVHPKFSVCDIDGTIYTPKGHPAITVTDKRKKRA